MKIPYGISDFAQIRDEGFFYADKTPFLPVLEAHYRHVVFLRPRRFGKSTLVSMLEHYYDLGRRDRWDALFGGLWVHDHPTGEQSSYLVLTLDFSSVATDGGEDVLRRTFLESVRGSVLTFLLRHRDRLPSLRDLEEQIARLEDASALIGRVVPLLLGDRALRAGSLVFIGAKRVLFRPWDRDAMGPKKARGRRRV